MIKMTEKGLKELAEMEEGYDISAGLPDALEKLMVKKLKYDLSEFEKRVELGLLRKSEKNGLILYKYTDQCTFSKSWDEYTRVARGLILDREGVVVGKTFEKFYNLLEMPETQLENLPNLPYKVQEKLDGSMLTIFHHNGEWKTATCGSFYSDQAIKAKELLKKYNLTNITKNTTILCEIIYPENKIIVSYNGEEKLVLLALFDRDTGEEQTIPGVWESLTGMPQAKTYDYTIEEMIALQKTLPKDQEGFVVRFENGLRVKIKSNEYMRIAKMISHMSPISFWESMEKGIVKRDYLAQLPEEFRADFEPIVDKLEEQYKMVMDDIKASVVAHGIFEMVSPDPIWKKNVGLFLQNNKVWHGSAIFPFLLGNQEALNKYVMKTIRPDGNSIRNLGE